MNYEITIITSLEGAKNEELASGKVVELIPEPKNAVDADAIAAYLDGEQIGYVANAASTIISNTQGASAIKSLVANKKVRRTTAKLLSEEEYIGKNNVQLKRFRARCYFVPKASKKAKSVQSHYLVGGATVSNLDKPTILNRILNKEAITEPVIVRRFKVSDTEKFVVSLANSLNAAGEIKNPDKQLQDWFERHAQLNAVITGDAEDDNYSIAVTFVANDVSIYEEEIAEAIARGVDQANKLSERVAFMSKEGMGEKLIRKVLLEMPALDERLQALVPVPKNPYVQVSGNNLARSLAYQMCHKNVRLVGEKGSGKNTLAETLCWLRNRPMYRLQGSSELDKMDLLGTQTLENGNLRFRLSDFLQMLQVGGVVVIDEANTIKPEVAVLLHSLTDGAKAVDVPGYGRVEMDPEASIILTMNEDYIGTGEMNAATIDRFATIMVNAEDDVRELLMSAVPNASKTSVTICSNVHANIRKSVKEGKLSPEAISTRGLIDSLECSEFLTLGEALLDNIAYKAQNEEERTIMEGIIQSFCS